MTRHHHSNHCPVGVPNCCSVNPVGFSTALGFYSFFFVIDCDLKSVGSKFTTKNFTLISHAWCSIITTITAKRMRFFIPHFFSLLFWSINFLFTGQIRKHNSKSPLSNPIPKPVKPRTRSSNSNNCSSSTPPKPRSIYLCLVSLAWPSRFLASLDCLFPLSSASKRSQNRQSSRNRRKRQ